MEHIRLGRTDLFASPAGLGCGGYSRLGMRQGNDERAAVKVVQHAMDLGINFFDTARAYGTEAVVGRAIAGHRDSVIISTKTLILDADGAFMPAERLVESLERSLRRLGTDCVDIYSFHGITDDQLDHVIEHYVPVLQDQVIAGKIRHLGITESFMREPAHGMLARAIPSDLFDVVMVGFNFLNASAREAVFEHAIKHDVATQVMHAVRRVLTSESLLLEAIEKLVASGEIDQASLAPDDPLGFLSGHPDIESLTDAAYRYCRHEPGVSVVLTGTGNVDHLSENVASILREPLPDDLLAALNRVFRNVRSASGD